MTKICLEIWSDYVCPFCYLQLPAIKEVARDASVQVRWRAFELRPEPAPLLDPKGEYLRRVWEGSVYPMAERQGQTIKLPPVQPRSRKALETAEFARHKAKFEPVHEALFKAFFLEGRDISQTNVLLEIAGEAGLAPMNLLGTLEAKEYAPKVLGDQKVANRLGILAVPAIVIHLPEQPVESGKLLSGTRTVREIEAGLEEMKAAAKQLPRSGGRQ